MRWTDRRGADPATSCCRARPATPQELSDWTDRFARVAKLRETDGGSHGYAMRPACCPISAGASIRIIAASRRSGLITNGNFGSVNHHGRAFRRALCVLPLRRISAPRTSPRSRSARWCSPAQGRTRLFARRVVQGRASHFGGAAGRTARHAFPPAKDRKMMLVFEHRMVDLVADRVGSRFKQLARLVGKSGSIVRR